MESRYKTDNQFVLKVSCRTGTGIVSSITSYLADRGCNITELSQFDDKISGQFFMRCVFSILEDS